MCKEILITGADCPLARKIFCMLHVDMNFSLCKRFYPFRLDRVLQSYKAKSSGVFSVCQDLQAIQDILVHAVLCFFFFSLKKSEAFSLCGFATPFFFPNSRSPITRSNLEFTASNNCLMDPHVYTA